MVAVDKPVYLNFWVHKQCFKSINMNEWLSQNWERVYNNYAYPDKERKTRKNTKRKE